MSHQVKADQELWQTCMHEAGHAIADGRAGLTTDEVVVEQVDGEWGGYVSFAEFDVDSAVGGLAGLSNAQLLGLAVSCLAGESAELRAGADSTSRRGYASESDIDIFAEALSELARRGVDEDGIKDIERDLRAAQRRAEGLGRRRLLA